VTDQAFAAEVYNGLNTIYRGLGMILAAMAKRYMLGKRAGRLAPVQSVDSPMKEP
jgi:hypothetical protein